MFVHVEIHVNEKYEVETILNLKCVRKNLLYFVHRRGFDKLMNEHGNQIPILKIHKIRFKSSTLGFQRANFL